MAVIILIILLILVTIHKNKYYLELTIPNNSTLLLATYDEHEESAKTEYTFTKSGKYNVVNKSYNYTLNPTDTRLAAQSGTLTLNGKLTYLNINESDYSVKELSNMYKQSEAEIINSINSKYPNQMKTFSTKYGKLYKKGDWFGGKLVQEGSEYKDKYLIVLHKENNEWKVVTTPDISLSKDVYPDVPRDVLEELNIVTRDESMDREAKAQ